MKRKAVVALLASVALVAAGCGSTEKQTEAPATEAATEAATTEAAEEETTEAAEAETTEAVTEEGTTEAETTEAVTEEETTEAETTEAVTEEETTEAETTEAVTEEETTEAETTEAETEEETTEAETTEAETEEETTEAVTEAETTEAETTEEEATEAGEETSEETTESETETEAVLEMPEYVALDYITLGEYTGLEVTKDPVEVSDEDVQAMIDTNTIETLTEGTVEEGDTVNIDYVGEVDGEEFDGGSAEGYSLEIGSGTFIDGFEDGLIGVEVGATTDLNLTFPENYHSEDLAGKDVVFHVTVNSLSRVPELTDEVAAKVADGMTAEEYRASVREELEESAAIENENLAKQTLLTTVVDNATVNGYPVEYLEYNMEMTKNNYKSMAEMYGMTYEELIEAYGMDEETFTATLEEQLKSVLPQEMVMLAIAETEGIEIDDTEYTERLNEIIGETEGEDPTVTIEELEDYYGESYLRKSLLLDKVMDFLVENNTFVEGTEETTEEAVTEAESETEGETVAEAAEETETETAEAESETETETETESESETAAETETESEAYE